MPYIKQNRRDGLDPLIEELSFTLKMMGGTSGDYNYCISKLLYRAYQTRPGYTAVNDILGVLEGVKQEFYRRIAAPYEDKKVKENGDVYL